MAPVCWPPCRSLEYLLNISVGKRLLDLFGQVSCASGALAAFRRRVLIGSGGSSARDATGVAELQAEVVQRRNQPGGA